MDVGGGGFVKLYRKGRNSGIYVRLVSRLLEGLTFWGGIRVLGGGGWVSTRNCGGSAEGIASKGGGGGRIEISLRWWRTVQSN